ncbi:MAG: DUF4910 domain-containing protein [Bacteroidota bacterium]
MTPLSLLSPTHLPPTPPRADALLAFVETILPFRRSITGEGLRQTLDAISERIPLQVHEVFSGTPLLDWQAPQEWTVYEAHLTLPDGRRIADWEKHALHLVQYSGPREETMTLRDLRPHLHTLPEHPDWIPYRTAYWTDDWGFCIRHRTLETLEREYGEDAEIEVLIDSRLSDGSLSFGECILPGKTDREILLTAHACHPALANDNASAMAVATFAAEALLTSDSLHHTIRILFAPGTIGALAWLAANPGCGAGVVGGLVLANLGDSGPLVYKQTRRASLQEPTITDRAVRSLFPGIDTRPFEPFGYDERQFNSPGFNLPIGRLTRTPHGEYPEYHTSADDLSLLSPEAMEESLHAVLEIVHAMDRNARYTSTQPLGEPMLGRRGLYEPVGGKPLAPEAQRAMLWNLNLADGQHDLFEIADRSGLPFDAIRGAADRLLDAQLLIPAVDADD